MKNGPSIPGWAVGLIIALFGIALLGFGFKYVSGDGPLPESKYPKEAYLPPSYGGAASTYTKDGKPVGGRENAAAPAPATSAPGSDPNNPYAGSYGNRH